MDWFLIAAGAALAGFLGFAQWRGWIDLTGSRTSGGAGMGMLGIADELFAPNRHSTEDLREQQRRLPAPSAEAPDGGAPEDPFLWTADGGYGGRIRIDS